MLFVSSLIESQIIRILTHFFMHDNYPIMFSAFSFPLSPLFLSLSPSFIPVYVSHPEANSFTPERSLQPLLFLRQDSSFGALFGSNGDSGIVSASLTSGAGGAIADLLDLQSELSSLQKGLSEISQQRAQQNQKVLLVWQRCRRHGRERRRRVVVRWWW